MIKIKAKLENVYLGNWCNQQTHTTYYQKNQKGSSKTRLTWIITETADSGGSSEMRLEVISLHPIWYTGMEKSGLKNGKNHIIKIQDDNVWQGV